MLKFLLETKINKHNLSSRQVAKEAGISHTTVIRALGGEDVDLTTALKLSEWLNIAPTSLINSMSASVEGEGLSNKIAAVLERKPKLAEEFSKAMQLVLESKVDPAILDDISAYAAYRINLARTD